MRPVSSPQVRIVCKSAILDNAGEAFEGQRARVSHMQGNIEPEEASAFQLLREECVFAPGHEEALVKSRDDMQDRPVDRKVGCILYQPMHRLIGRADKGLKVNPREARSVMGVPELSVRASTKFLSCEEIPAPDMAYMRHLRVPAEVGLHPERRDLTVIVGEEYVFSSSSFDSAIAGTRRTSIFLAAHKRDTEVILKTSAGFLNTACAQ